jgi:hypothetical protein
MLVTVLLVVVASSIAFTVVRQALSDKRAADTAVDTAAANDTARATLAKLQGALEVAPLRFLTEVLGGEAPRRCTTGPNAGTTYAPGQAWPAACGRTWDYAPLDSGWEGTQFQLVPPGPQSAELRADIIVRTPLADVTLAARFTPRGSNRFTWLSTSSVNVADVAPSQTAAAQGNLYAAEVLGANSTAGAALTGTLSTESYDPTPAARPGLTWNDLAATRAAVATPPNPANLTGAATLLSETACPEAVADANIASGDGDGGSSATAKACLAAGGTLLLANGSTVTIPADTQAYAIATSGTTIKIWASPTAIDLTATSPLVCSGWPACDLRAHAEALMQAGDHPGALAFWQDGYLGEILYPATGVIAFDRTVSVGVCTNNSVSGQTQWPAGRPCAGAGRVNLAGRSLSVVAPAVVVGGPIASNGGSVALAATSVAGQPTSGRITLAYWASDPDGLAVDAHLVADADAAGIAGFPTGGVVPDSRAELRGSVNGQLTTFGVDGWADVAYTPSTTPAAGPWLHLLGVGWQLFEVRQT